MEYIELLEYIEQMTAPGLKRLIISKPAGKSEPYQKLTVEPIGQEWQISSYTDKQVFHENLPLEDLARRCAGSICCFSPKRGSVPINASGCPPPEGVAPAFARPPPTAATTGRRII